MRKRSGQQSRRTAAQMHALAAVRREIQSQDSVSGCKYLRDFAEAFRRYDDVLRPGELEQRICSADVVLIGDYHALPASQHFAAALVEIAARRRPVVLAFEAVLARDQRSLDEWWRREITSEELRRRLRFDREWGYPWDPFYELVSSARDQCEGMYGIDCVPRENLRRIRSRDRHAAAKIREIRERFPRAAILVVFGESHLAPGHLPRALRDLMPQDQVLTVLQNVDSLYWQALGQHSQNGQIAPVSIGEDVVCVFNSSPLEKYESYRLCLNRWSATQPDRQDFTPAIYNLIFSLARSLGFRLDSPCRPTQPKFLADALPEVVTLEDHSHGDIPQLAAEPCVYLPQSNSLVVREFQIADAAEECARFLHFVCRGMTPACTQAQSVLDTLARFGSRLLCPDLIDDRSLGDSLYDAYLNRRLTKARLRELFLAPLETREQAERTWTQISSLAHAGSQNSRAGR
jgi:Haem-binding uptake, Tiki superfamily, ChaN